MSDPLGSSVRLLIPFDGIDGSSIPADYSPWPLGAPTKVGTAAATSANQRWGQDTWTFPGDSYLNWPWSNRWNLYPSGSAEVDVFFNTVSTDQLLLYCGQYGSNEPWSILWIAGQQKFLSTQSFGTAFWSDAVPGLAAGQWHTITLDGDGPEYCFRLNGTPIGYRNGGTSFPNQDSQLWVGGVSWGARANVQLANLRLTKAARRTGSDPVTPPSAPYELPEQGRPRILTGPGRRIDTVDGGPYRIAGSVDRFAVPGQYRVRLFDKQSGRLIRQTWSDAQGQYEFRQIKSPRGGFIVTAEDHSAAPANAAISDQPTLDPMP